MSESRRNSIISNHHPISVVSGPTNTTYRSEQQHPPIHNITTQKTFTPHTPTRSTHIPPTQTALVASSGAGITPYDHDETLVDTNEQSPEHMTIDKVTMKRYARQWIELVDNIEPMKKQLRQLESHKKELEKYIMHFMNTYKITGMNYKEIKSGIECVKSVRRAPITRDHIIECLLKFEEDEQKAAAITTDIFESRKRIETTRLKRIQLEPNIDTIANEQRKN